MLRYLTQNQMLPLTTLLAVDKDSPYYHDEQKGSVFYAESWVLTHYIMVTDRAKGTHHLREYTEYLQRGEDPVTAAQHAFGDLTKLQQTLSMYVRGRNFTYFTMMATLSVKESSFAARSATVPEADAVRAEVMVITGRMNDAQALLDGALAADPKCAAAHEAMGFLKYREGDIASAKQWYGEAAQLDPGLYTIAVLFWGVDVSGRGQGAGGGD